MKIFIDTNIFLDLLLKRDSFKEAMLIFNAIEKEIFSGVILDITILNIDYIAKKQIKDIKIFLNTINSIFKIVGASNDEISKALDLDNRDLEDNLQYITAIKTNCDLIITNDKNFYNKDLRVISSKKFVKEYL